MMGFGFRFGGLALDERLTCRAEGLRPVAHLVLGASSQLGKRKGCAHGREDWVVTKASSSLRRHQDASFAGSEESKDRIGFWGCQGDYSNSAFEAGCAEVGRNMRESAEKFTGVVGVRRVSRQPGVNCSIACRVNTRFTSKSVHFKSGIITKHPLNLMKGWLPFKKVSPS